MGIELLGPVTDVIEVEGTTSQCPTCGADAQVLDGFYQAVDGILEIVVGPHAPRDEVQRLIQVLIGYQQQPTDAESLKEEIERAAPTLGAVTRYLPKDSGQLAAWVGIALVVVLRLFSQDAEDPGRSDEEIRQVVRQEVEKLVDRGTTIPYWEPGETPE